MILVIAPHNGLYIETQHYTVYKIKCTRSIPSTFMKRVVKNTVNTIIVAYNFILLCIILCEFNFLLLKNPLLVKYFFFITIFCKLAID